MARQASLLVDGLRRLGVDVHVLAPFSRAKLSRYGHVFFLRKIPETDVYFIASHVVSHFRLRLPRDRTIIWVADLIPLRWGPPQARIFLKTEMLFMRSAGLVGNSNYTTQRLREYFPREVLGYIYPPLAPEFYPRSKKEVNAVREKYNLPDEFILHVGNTKPHKNIGVLFEAASIVHKPVVKVGGDEHTIRELAERFGVDVVYIPFVASDDELAAIYSAASVYVQPSLEEGFGYPVVEAAACGTPVIVSNRGPLPEIARLVAGQVVPPTPLSIAETIAAVPRRVSSRVVKTVRATFSPESSARSLLDLLRRMWFLV